MKRLKELKQFYNNWSIFKKGSQRDWLDKDSAHYERFKRYIELSKPYIKEDLKILDVGCGEGNLLMILPECKKYGIDIVKRYVNIAKIKNSEAMISLANAEKIPFRDNFFGFIFCTEVIEHVINPIKLLGEIKRVLKKRGYAIISTYNHWNITNIINLKAFTNKFCSEDHLREYNYFSLKKILEKYFKINYFSSVGLTPRMKKIISRKYSIIPLYNFLVFLIKNEK